MGTTSVANRRLGRPVLALLAFTTLVALASCSSAAESVADSQVEAASEPTPSAPPGDDGDGDGDGDGENFTPPDFPDSAAGEPRDVPPLTLPFGAPGTDAEAEALIASLDRFITDEQRAAGVPWPDLRNPDPIAVYRSCADFQNWMSENNTAPSLVEAYTVPGSPERGWDVDMFSEFTMLDVVSTPSDPPYSMQVNDLVHPAATGITDTLLGEVPEGSAAIVYWDSVGPSELVQPDGSVLLRTDGWTNKGPWVAIMAPTDVGWQVWWDELTEPAPPGLEEDRGAPQTGPDRRDV